MPASESSSAISRIVEVPLPLSLMPGPSMTESRCAPTTTVFAASPFLESAITLLVGRISENVCANTWTTVSPARVFSTSSAPSA